MDFALPLDIDSVKGFLSPVEGAALYRAALECAPLGPCLEIGSYCGKSTVYLGAACQRSGGVLFAVDHHRGSEEHQLGEEYLDPALYDGAAGLMDSFREFRATMRRAKTPWYRWSRQRALRRAPGARRCRWCSSTAGTAWRRR